MSQDLRHQGPRPTADIDDGPRAAQDVGRGELASHGQGPSQHAGRRARLRLRVRRVVLEQGRAVDAVERRLAGANGVQQLAERVIHLLAEVDDGVAHAAGCVGAQRRGRVVGREAAVLELVEDARDDERAEHASQLRRPRADRVRDGLGSQRLRAQHVGHAQLRRDIQRLRELVALRDPQHGLLGGFHRDRSYAL